MRNTGASAKCGGDPYANLPDPLSLLGPRIQRVYVGSRQLSNYSGTIMTCDRIAGDVLGPDSGFPQTNGHVRGCRHVGGAACGNGTWQALDSQGQTVNQHVVGSHFEMLRVAAGTTCTQVRGMTFP